VRKGLGNDPHPACRAAGHTTVRACKDASDQKAAAPDKEALAGSASAAGPSALVAARKAAPWRRGTWAVIGGTHFVVVRSANSDMGTAAHDCPAGEVVEEELSEEKEVKEEEEAAAARGASSRAQGVSRVFDQLYSGYGNVIDNRGALKKTGPDQR
jgi:hypothetical protein